MIRACLKCGVAQDFVFCPDCAPPKDSVVVLFAMAIFVGHINVLKALFYRLCGKNVIRWWLGSDVLYLVMFPPGRGKLSMVLHRLHAAISEMLIAEHWTDSENLRSELRSVIWVAESKSIRVEPHVGRNLKVFEKKDHDGINIAYYHPRTNTRYQRWLYGVDIVDRLVPLYPQLNWTRLDGTADMSTIFPILDIYVRPNRHDGRSRLKEECRMNNIPVVSTNTINPDFDKICRELSETINSNSLYSPNRQKNIYRNEVGRSERDCAGLWRDGSGSTSA